jgi:hypothetical protein
VCDRQVGFGQQQRPGHAARLAIPGRKREELLVDQREARAGDRLTALRCESVGIDEQRRFAGTAVQIGGEVQALHGEEESNR